MVPLMPEVVTDFGEKQIDRIACMKWIVVYRNEQWRSAGNMMKRDRTYGLWNCHWARTSGQRNEERNQSGPTLIERPQSHHRSQRRNGSVVSSRPRTLPGPFYQCVYSFQLGHFWIPSLPGHASPDNLPVCYSKCANLFHVSRMSFPGCENGNMRQPVSVEDLTFKQ